MPSVDRAGKVQVGLVVVVHEDVDVERADPRRVRWRPRRTASPRRPSSRRDLVRAEDGGRPVERRVVAGHVELPVVLHDVRRDGHASLAHLHALVPPVDQVVGDPPATAGAEQVVPAALAARR